EEIEGQFLEGAAEKLLQQLELPMGTDAPVGQKGFQFLAAGQGLTENPQILFHLGQQVLFLGQGEKSTCIAAGHDLPAHCSSPASVMKSWMSRSWSCRVSSLLITRPAASTTRVAISSLISFKARAFSISISVLARSSILAASCWAFRMISSFISSPTLVALAMIA